MRGAIAAQLLGKMRQHKHKFSPSQILNPDACTAHTVYMSALCTKQFEGTLSPLVIKVVLQCIMHI